MQQDKNKETEKRLIEKAMKDEQFRKQLINDPNAAISQELGMKIPAHMKIHVLEEKADELYLILPMAPAGEEHELTEKELSSVSGGTAGSGDVESHWSYCGC